MTADDRCVLPCAAHHSAIALAVTMLTAGYVPTTALGHVTTLLGGGMQAPTTALGHVTTSSGGGMQALTTALPPFPTGTSLVKSRHWLVRMAAMGRSCSCSVRH